MTRPPRRRTQNQTGSVIEPSPADAARLLYEEVVRTRDRLAELPAPTSADAENVTQILHELVWFLITPPVGATWSVDLSDTTRAELLAAARNRTLDLYVMVAALLAWKRATLPGTPKVTRADQLVAIDDALDALCFDYRTSKKHLVETLRQVRADLDARIRYLSALRRPSFRFATRPERYNERKNKRERPDEFFERVYAIHVPRGLTQADIRHTDPKFYNVLHVWCTRNERKLSSFVPPARTRT